MQAVLADASFCLSCVSAHYWNFLLVKWQNRNPIGYFHFDFGIAAIAHARSELKPSISDPN